MAHVSGPSSRGRSHAWLAAVVITVVVASLGAVPGRASAAPGSQLWADRYGSAHLGDSASLGVSPDGSEIFMTGGSLGSTGSQDYATVAYDASTGAELWVKRYNGPGDAYDYANAVAVSPAGSKVFVTGQSAGSTSRDYATVAYDASTGAELWVRRYNGPGDGADNAGALGVSPDGTTVFVTGASPGSREGYDYATVAYDASTGSRLWTTRYNGPGDGWDSASGIGVSSDGTVVFVTGTAAGSTSPYDYATVAYDASTGAELWVKVYNGADDDFDFATALRVSPDGSKVFVTGYSGSSSTGRDDYITLAYEATTGSRLWIKRYNGPANLDDDATALGVSPDGTMVFVTGITQGSTNQFDYDTVAYDASTGAELWVKLYNGPAHGSDVAQAVGVSPDGSLVFVTGYSDGITSSVDYATVAYDAATGARLWARRYNSPANSDDDASALGVSPDGTMVFVTGLSRGKHHYHFATVAYSVT